MSVQDEIRASESVLGLGQVKQVIGVASGKGGVGKSSVSFGLAMALTRLGQKVGLLDGDIYGPSQQKLLGVDPSVRAQSNTGKSIEPIQAHGIQSMSMAYLVTEKTPMVWRGPMASSALQQMLFQTNWGELDILIVDLPPGTGDIQLTLSQKLDLAGVLVVTTPSQLALIDAEKAMAMFQKVNVPLLGVVENMSYHTCPQCAHQDYIFGKNAAQGLALAYGCECLGELPLDGAYRMACDDGQPLEIHRPEHPIVTEFTAIAKALLHRLKEAAPALPSVEDVDE